MEILSRASLRIAHVEDDHDFAAFSTVFLQKAGFEQPVIHCKHGVDAIRYFSNVEIQQSPHVVLLDLHMPHMDGLEMLHWLRHGYIIPDIPVYLLTSSNEIQDRCRAAAGGATGYILKTPAFDDVIYHLDQEIAILNERSIPVAAPGRSVPSEPFILSGEDLYFDSQETFSG